MSHLNRRRFLTTAALGAAVVSHRVARASANQAPAQTPPQPPATPDAIPYGQTKLGLSDDLRDGSLYVPKSYRDETPAPVMVMLHGYSGWGDDMKSIFALAEEFGVVIVAPDSRDVTWGRSAPGFDQDVRFIGAAFRKAAQTLNLDPDKVALGGRSDGAGYALSMGLAYGNTFNHLIVIAGGMMAPVRRQGKPKIFMAHGIQDTQMPIDRTGRLFQKQLKDEGYDVTYREYDGGHATPVEVVREAFVWLTGRKD
ncbi:MAG: PHB depolymerase family esterase [Vicinamibacterales bacterium]